MTADKPGKIKPPALQETLVPSEQRVERAAGDFRRGAPVLIRADAAGASGLAVAAETVRDGTLPQLAGIGGPASLILTHARAATLKIRLYTAEMVSIPLSATMSASDIRAIADPATDLDYPAQGPLRGIAHRTSPIRRGQRQAGQACGSASGRGAVPRSRQCPRPNTDRGRDQRRVRLRHRWVRTARGGDASARGARVGSAGRRGRRGTRRLPPRKWRARALRGHHRRQGGPCPRPARSGADAAAFGMFHRRSAGIAEMRLRRSVARRGPGNRESRRRRAALSRAGGPRHRA